MEIRMEKAGIIRYDYKKERKEISLSEYEKSGKTVERIRLFYCGPYLDGAFFRTREDPGSYFIAPISEEELKQIIPEEEFKLYITDTERKRDHLDAIKKSIVNNMTDEEKERVAQYWLQDTRYLKRKEK